MKLVDLGRGEVRPKRAKALRIPIRGVQFIQAEGGTKAAIFRKKARPAPPQLVTDRALIQTQSQARLVAQTGDFDISTRRGLSGAINAVAELLAGNIKQLIKGKSGKLEKSIRVEKSI